MSAQSNSAKKFTLGLIASTFCLSVVVVLGPSAGAFSVTAPAHVTFLGTTTTTAAPSTWNSGPPCSLNQNGGLPNATAASGFMSLDVHADALAGCQDGSQSTYAGFVLAFSCAPPTCPAAVSHTFTVTINWTASWYINTTAASGTGSSSLATVFLYGALLYKGTVTGSGSVNIDSHSLTGGVFTHSAVNSLHQVIFSGSVPAGATGFDIVTYLAGTTHAVGGAAGSAYAETDLRNFGPDYLNSVGVT